MDPTSQFEREREAGIAALGADASLGAKTRAWLLQANAGRYSYHFTALGRPIIQYPQDMVAVQELIWQVRPTLVVETGVAHGGSLVMSAAALALLDYADACEAGLPLDPRASRRRVIGVDIDIRAHNRAAIEAHPLRHKIELLQGSSIDPAVVDAVRNRVEAGDRVMVMLDSNHTHDHVLAELQAYAPLVGPGSYCIVFDTVIEDMPADSFPDRPWGVGNSPKTAVRAYLDGLAASPAVAGDGGELRFAVDKAIDGKLAISVAPDGYLRRLPVA